MDIVILYLSTGSKIFVLFEEYYVRFWKLNDEKQIEFFFSLGLLGRLSIRGFDSRKQANVIKFWGIIGG